MGKGTKCLWVVTALAHGLLVKKNKPLSIILHRSRLKKNKRLLFWVRIGFYKNKQVHASSGNLPKVHFTYHTMRRRTHWGSTRLRASPKSSLHWKDQKGTKRNGLINTAVLFVWSLIHTRLKRSWDPWFQYHCLWVFRLLHRIHTQIQVKAISTPEPKHFADCSLRGYKCPRKHCQADLLHFPQTTSCLPLQKKSKGWPSKAQDTGR